MKILEMLLAFLATQAKAFMQTSRETLSEHLVNNARRLATLLAILVISITLFCTGFSMAYTAIVSVVERDGTWHLSAGFIGGAILAAAALGGLVYSLGEERWRRATGQGPHLEPARAAPQGPKIESALAAIIVEIATELKEKRRHDHRSPAESENEDSRKAP